MKKVIFEGNGLTLTEKMNKDGVSLIFKMMGASLKLNVVANDNIKLVIEDVEAGVFGYSDDEIKEKNLNFRDFKIKTKTDKVTLLIPYVNGKKPKKVSVKQIIEAIENVVTAYDKEKKDRLDESMNELQRVKHNIMKFGL